VFEADPPQKGLPEGQNWSLGRDRLGPLGHCHGARPQGQSGPEALAIQKLRAVAVREVEAVLEGDLAVKGAPVGPQAGGGVDAVVGRVGDGDVAAGEEGAVLGLAGAGDDAAAGESEGEGGRQAGRGGCNKTAVRLRCGLVFRSNKTAQRPAAGRGREQQTAFDYACSRGEGGRKGGATKPRSTTLRPGRRRRPRATKRRFDLRGPRGLGGRCTPSGWTGDSPLCRVL
jgi:hypothetical protein